MAREGSVPYLKAKDKILISIWIYADLCDWCVDLPGLRRANLMERKCFGPFELGPMGIAHMDFVFSATN